MQNKKNDDFTESKETPPILSQKNVFAGPEETHFLFYFSIMTLLSMLFYLALYNKKKVSVQLFNSFILWFKC